MAVSDQAKHIQSDKTKKEKKKSSKPKPKGRPSKFNPKFCKGLIAHMSKGFSFETYAWKINVNQDTLHEWVKNHADFSEAKAVAVIANLYYYENVGIRMMNGKIKRANFMAWFVNMRNRHKWHNNTAVTLRPGQAHPDGLNNKPQIIITLPSNGREAVKEIDVTPKQSEIVIDADKEKETT